MQDSIELLMNEHRMIEKGLTALDTFCGQLVEKQIENEREELSQFLTFIEEFSDRTHHGKEENILFEEMVGAGFPKDMGPIAVMLAEHEEGRSYVRSIKEKLEKDPWSDEDRTAIATSASAFTGLLRPHILKEDQILYPMARQRLPADIFTRIDERCEAFEKGEKEKGDHDRLWKLGEALVERYGN